MTFKKPLTPSLEDYLEAVYALSRAAGLARACDVSRRLKVSKPSVNSAVMALTAWGLLGQERYGSIKLSPAGLRAGAEIAGRIGGGDGMDAAQRFQDGLCLAGA